MHSIPVKPEPCRRSGSHPHICFGASNKHTARFAIPEREAGINSMFFSRQTLKHLEGLSARSGLSEGAVLMPNDRIAAKNEARFFRQNGSENLSGGVAHAKDFGKNAGRSAFMISARNNAKGKFHGGKKLLPPGGF